MSGFDITGHGLFQLYVLEVQDSTSNMCCPKKIKTGKMFNFYPADLSMCVSPFSFLKPKRSSTVLFMEQHSTWPGALLPLCSYLLMIPIIVLSHESRVMKNPTVMSEDGIEKWTQHAAFWFPSIEVLQ